MKKFFIVMMLVLSCLGVYAQTSSPSTISIPSKVESYALNLAEDFGLVTVTDKEYIIKHNVIDKVLEACLSCDVSKVTDTIAQAMVDEGKFPNLECARKGMLATAERYRSSDSFWDRIYRYVGLK